LLPAQLYLAGEEHDAFCAAGTGRGDATEGGQLQALSGTGERMGGPGSGARGRRGGGRGTGPTGRRKTTPVEINPNQLPSDPAALRQMVVGLLGEAVERERKLRQLQDWGEQLLRARYGPRRGRVDENQLFMFAAEIMARAEKAPPASGETEAPPSDTKSTPQRPGHGRGALPKSLPRQRLVHDLGEGARQCPQCQGELKRLGEEVSERLEYVPASLVVI